MLYLWNIIFQMYLHTCFTIGSSVAIVTSTSVAIHIICTSTIYTWAGSTFIDICEIKYLNISLAQNIIHHQLKIKK